MPVLAELTSLLSAVFAYAWAAILAELPPLLSAVLGYAWAAILATAGQLALLLGPGLALGLALHVLSSFVNRRASRYLGRAYYLLFGWLGTAVHEVGHAVFCLLFAHRITDVKLFDFAPRDGSLGYVRHSYDRSSLYQRAGNFFIGIGPIIFGTLVVIAAARWLLGAEVLARMRPAAWDGGLARSPTAWVVLAGQVAAGAGEALGALLVPSRLADWRAWAFLYVAFTVGSSISLSIDDLKGAFSGFATIVLLVLIGNLATLWWGEVLGSGVVALAGWLAVAYAALLFALAVNALAAIVVLVVPGLLRC
jgi:hypothetical protein